MLKLLCISIHIANFSLYLQNFTFSTVRTVKWVELHLYAKLCWKRFNRGRDIAIFRYFRMAAAVILDFRNLNFLNSRDGREGQTASLCQISSKLRQLRPRYGDFSIFQDGDRRHRGFSKFKILNVRNSQEGRAVLPCQISSKSFELRLWYRDFSIFQVGGRRHLGFLKSQIFNARNVQEGVTASVCQISSKSLEPRTRYVSFNIMLV